MQPASAAAAIAADGHRRWPDMQATGSANIRPRIVRAAGHSVAGVVLFAWGSHLAKPWLDIQAMGVDIPSFPPCSSMILQLGGLAFGVLALARWCNVAFNLFRHWKRRGGYGENAGQPQQPTIAPKRAIAAERQRR